MRILRSLVLQEDFCQTKPKTRLISIEVVKRKLRTLRLVCCWTLFRVTILFHCFRSFALFFHLVTSILFKSLSTSSKHLSHGFLLLCLFVILFSRFFSSSFNFHRYTWFFVLCFQLLVSQHDLHPFFIFWTVYL